MAVERKTVNVVSLKEMFNLRIRRSENAATRSTLAGMITDILMEANRYRGFGYCDADGKMVAYVDGVTDRTMVQYY